MSLITATYPLGTLESKAPSTAAATRVRPWAFWATLGWYGIAEVASVAAVFAAGFGYAVWWRLTHPGSPLNLDAPFLNDLGTAIAISTAALVLVLAARRRSSSVRDYLGLVWPHWRDIVIGFGLLAALYFLLTGIELLFPSADTGEAMISEYRAALSDPAALVMLWIAVAVTAPIAEEIIYRGFLLRGWSESRLGMVGALVLSSLVFAAVHLQYDLRGMAQVFALGIIFGLMRWKSGSTVLAIMMHAGWNITVSVLVALSV